MPQRAINFFSQNVNYNLREKNNIRKWLEAIVSEENKKIAELNYIFCDDAFLLKLNKKYLNHNTYTDVISFDQSADNERIKGEIYLSIDRIKENATTYGVTMKDELKRVLVHGLLHLIDYDDKDEEGKQVMREKENYYISLL